MMPVIRGQHQAYLVRQIGQFKVRNRANEPMLALIKEIPEPEIAMLAEHFAQKPWPRLNRLLKYGRAERCSWAA
jgi:cytochrome c553